MPKSRKQSNSNLPSNTPSNVTRSNRYKTPYSRVTRATSISKLPYSHPPPPHATSISKLPYSHPPPPPNATNISELP